MARTKYGKLTGRAASAELRDQREFLDEMADPNSQYWQDKLAGKKEQILKNPHCKAVWDSPLVPERATYREHAEIAQAILNGELDEQYRILQNSESILSLTDRAAAEQDERFAAAVRQFSGGLDETAEMVEEGGRVLGSFIDEAVGRIPDYLVNRKRADEYKYLAGGCRRRGDEKMAKYYEDAANALMAEVDAPSVFPFRDYVTRKVTAGID